MIPQNVNVMKYKEKLGKHPTLKKTKDTRQLNEMHNLGLPFAKKEVFETNGKCECLRII